METTNIIQTAKDYACFCHWSVNHFYNDRPYSYHLKMVYDYGDQYKYLIPNVILRTNVLASLWTHDVIEDARQTYNDVKEATNEIVADITFALTNEKGKTRKDRANDKYYAGIRNQPGAVFAKLCDRLANAKYSKNTNSSMLNAYQKEYFSFKQMIVTNITELNNPYSEMFNELNQLLVL